MKAHRYLDPAPHNGWDVSQIRLYDDPQSLANPAQVSRVNDKAIDFASERDRLSLSSIVHLEGHFATVLKSRPEASREWDQQLISVANEVVFMR